MTPGKHVCLCVAIVLFVTHLVNGATPDIQNGQDQTITKIQETDSKKKDPISGNGKGPPSQKPIRTFDCIEEDTECSKDKFGYEAIMQLHRLIDDDHNGNVDQSESDESEGDEVSPAVVNGKIQGYEDITQLHRLIDDDLNGNVDQSESEEFLRDELQYTDGFERHSLFHNNDKLISVDDLWRAWKYSSVYNWTVDEVVDWLQNEVDLPQYANMFLDNAVTGSFLPRLAASNTFMSTVLGIKNPVHKQKLALKAMDTVLFGAPPKRHSYVKDLVLVASLIFAVGGCWFAYLHHRYSQEQVRKMMIDLESLQKAEEALMDVQRKLEDAENRQVSSVSLPPPDFKEGTAVPQADLPISNYGGKPDYSMRAEDYGGSGEGTRQIKAELAATLLALQQAETQLENSWAPPGELQAWLQMTHELEQLHYNAKRQAAERQFQSAKDVCDKIKRRNKAFFGSLRMAHSNSLDEIDQRILDARMALEEVKQDLQERLHRWHNIERLCGFPIISNPGLAALHQQLHGTRDGNGNRLPGAVVGPVSVDEADEDLPPAEVDNVGPLPYDLFPDTVHIEKERQASHKRGTLRRQARISKQCSGASTGNTLPSGDRAINEIVSRLSPTHASAISSFPTMPHNVSSSKGFSRHRANAMGSTGSLSHLSRTGVNINANYGMPSHPSFSARGSVDTSDSPSPTTGTLSNPVNFHLGDQHQDNRMNYLGHHGAPNNHIRNKSMTPSTVSSVNSTPVPNYQSYSSVSTQHQMGGQATMQAQYAVSRSDSDDNLSQATMDSLPRSTSSNTVRERLRVSNNNGLDLVNHTMGSQVTGSDSHLLGPSLLQKKPSKRKKLLNMFRKTSNKQKPV